MRLLPKNAARQIGRVLFEGRDLLTLSEHEMRGIRGNSIGMIFQEPMTSLNPVHTIGEQIAEVVRIHRNVGHRAAQARAEEVLRLVRIPDAQAPAARLSAPVLGRDAPARDDRDGAGVLAAAADRG